MIKVCAGLFNSDKKRQEDCQILRNYICICVYLDLFCITIYALVSINTNIFDDALIICKTTKELEKQMNIK